MKITKNKIFGLLLCLILVTDMYVAFESKLKVAKKNTISNSVSGRSATEPILRINNRLGNLAVGILQGLADSETGWAKCIPQTWKNPESIREDRNIETFKQAGGVFTKVWEIVKKVLEVACPATKIMQNLRKLTENFFSEQKSKMFLEGQYTRGIRTKLKDKLSKLKQEFKDAWHALSKDVQEVFTSLEDHFAELRNRIVSLYQSEGFQKFITILQCLKGAGSAVYNIYSVISGFITKISTISALAAGSMGAGAIPVVAKLIWGLICKFKEFGRAVNYFKEFLAAREPGKKFFLLGLFIGQIVNAIGTA